MKIDRHFWHANNMKIRSIILLRCAAVTGPGSSIEITQGLSNLKKIGVYRYPQAPESGPWTVKIGVCCFPGSGACM